MRLYWGERQKDSEKNKNCWSSLSETEVYRINNNVFFNTDVFPESVEKAITLTYEIINETKHPITGYFDIGPDGAKSVVYHINSYGGDVASMWKFIDFLDYCKKIGLIDCTISIINSVACSAATLLAVACDLRYITPHSTVMIHEISAGLGGMFTHLESYIKNLQWHHDKIVDFYKEQTGLKKKKIKKLLIKETWLTPEEYKKLGFVKDILHIEELENEEETE